MPNVFYGNGNSGPSLAEQITRAQSIADVHALLGTGAGYVNATPRTKNRWQRLASKRIAQLKSEAVR
jgi:adenylate kinase